MWSSSPLGQPTPPQLVPYPVPAATTALEGGRTLDLYVSSLGSLSLCLQWRGIPVMRIKVLWLTPGQWPSSMCRRRTRLWYRSSGIRCSIIYVYLWRQCSPEGMLSQRLGVLKSRLCLRKLSQLRFHKRTCEFCVPHLFLSTGVGIISRPL
jgi:hypothetical protein